MKKPKNYVNNKTLYGTIIHYKSEVKEAKRNDQQTPRIPDYIGQAILLICNNLARKPNFSGYSCKEDMINDAVMDCVAAVDKFDPDKTSNPFAYFTQIAWNAFIRRIHKEKKQLYIKHKNYENMFMTVDIFDESNKSAPLKSNDVSSEIIRSYEEKLTKPKKKSKLVGLDRFSVDIEGEQPTQTLENDNEERTLSSS